MTFTSGSGLTQTQNFNGLPLNTTNNNINSTQLGQNWYRSNGSTSSQALTGNVVTGNSVGSIAHGVYNCASSASSTDRSVGAVASGSGSHMIGVQLLNTSGSVISSFSISGAVEKYRAGTSNAVTERVIFQYSTNATSLETGSWTAVTSLDLVEPDNANVTSTSALDGNLALNRGLFSGSITGLTLANNSSIWIRWSDSDASGTDALLALDDVSITATTATSCTSQTITALTTSITKTFGDAPYSVFTNSSSNLTVIYASSNENVATVATDGTVTIVGAGSTTITASQEGNSTYCAATPVTQALTVNKAASIITATGATSFVYNGSPQGPNTSNVTGSTGARTYTYTGVSPTSYVSSTTRPTAAGTYKVVATVAADANYLAATSADYNFEITKATPSITATGTTTYTYNGSGQGPATNTTNSTGIVSYSYSGVSPTVYGPNAAKPIEVGTYQVIATVATDANYIAADSAPLAFTINKANSTIVIEGGLPTYAYTGSGHGPTNATATGSSGAVTFEYSGTGTTVYGPSNVLPIEVGTYQAVASVAADANYNGASSTAYAYSITSEPVPTINSSLTVSATYGVLSTSYFITATNTPTSYNATGLPAGLSINTVTGEISGTPTALPGNYNVTLTATNGGGTSLPATLVYTIAKKEVTITGASVANKEYDGNTTATLTGALFGVIAADAGSVSLTASAYFADANVGDDKPVTSDSTLGGAKAAYYALTQPTGLKANITKATPTVTATGATTFTYNGSAQGPATATVSPAGAGTATYSYSGTENGGATYGPTATRPTNAGSYSVVASVAASANYNAASSSPLTFSIDKATQTLSLSNITKVTTDAPFSLGAATTTNASQTVTYTGGSGVITINGNNATIVGAGSNITINASAPATANYNTYSGSFTLNVSFNTAVVPNATAATAISSNGFTANWDAVTGATSYELDVYKIQGTEPVGVTVAGWTFPTATVASQTANQGNLSNSGIAQITAVGGLGTISWPASPSSLFSVSGNDWTNGNGTKYWQTIVNTTGVNNITVSSIQGSSGSGPNQFKLQYKIGSSGTWTDVAGGVVTLTTAVVGGTLSTWGALTDVALPAEAGNKAELYIRWLCNTSTSVNNGTIGGTSRIAAVSIKGQVGGPENVPIAGSPFTITAPNTFKAVSGLSSNTTYYYAVRAINGASTSANSDVISVTTEAILATFDAVTQSAFDCNAASFVLSGLTPGANTVYYTLNGTPSSTFVFADGNGNATLDLPLTIANNGQTLAITAVELFNTPASKVIITQSDNSAIVVSITANITTNGSVTTSICQGDSYVWPANGQTYTTAQTGLTHTVGCNTATLNLTVTSQLTWYLDSDSDGYYTGAPIVACSSPGNGYTTTVVGGGDCRDDLSTVYPGALEICFNNIDDDCDGLKSEGCQLVSSSLTSSYPNNLILGSITTTIMSTVPVVPGHSITGYIFEITRLSDNVTAPELYRPNNKFNLTMTNIYAYNDSFAIRVRVIVNGEEQPYLGDTRVIRTPSISSPSLSSQCNQILPTIGTTIVSSSVVGATAYEFSITSSTFGNPSVQVIQRQVNNFRLSMMPNYTPAYNTVYEVSVRAQVAGVWSNNSTTCSITTPSVPTISLVSSQCDQALATLNTTLTTPTVAYASAYKFKVSKVSEPSVEEEVLVVGSPSFRLNMLTTITAEYETSYNVWVKAVSTVNGVTVEGNYASVPCVVTTPLTPFVNIVGLAGDCETGFRPASLSSVITSETYPGARYRFILRGYDSGTNLIYDNYVDRTQNNVTLSMFPTLAPGLDYVMIVALRLSGTVVMPKNECIMIIPGTSAPSRLSSLPFAATAYPNPFENNFLINLTTSSQAPVSLKVYDMLGRLMTTYESKANDLSTLAIGDQYPSGVYNVVLTQGDEVRTLRVVKR